MKNEICDGNTIGVAERSKRLLILKKRKNSIMKNRLSYLLFSLLMVISVHADIVIRDQFDAIASGQVVGSGEYLAGTGITNAVNNVVYGGTIEGFTTSEAWYGNTDLVKPSVNGLAYSSGNSTLLVSGGKLQLDISSEDDSVREVAREMHAAGSGYTWYFSALIKASADTDGTAVVRFDDIDGLAPTHSPYIWGVGFGFEGGDIVLITRSGEDSRISHTVMSDYVAGTTYMVIVKIVVDSNVGLINNDTVSIWINPSDLGSIEAAGDPDFITEVNTFTLHPDLMIDELRIYTSDFGGGVIDIDEVHMGHEWWEVAPASITSTLTAYDDFECADSLYEAGVELNGQGPNRVGFLGSWGNSTSSDWMPYNENLVYTNGSYALKTSGGSAQVAISDTGSKNIDRSTVDITDGVVYVSCLMNFDLDGGTDDYAYVGLMDGDDTTYYAGARWGVIAGKIGVMCRGTSGNPVDKFYIGDGSYVEGESYLFIIKMEKNVVSGYIDRISIYLNPSNLASESANTKDIEALVGNIVGTTVLDQIVISSSAVTDGLFKVDEIRVGTTWDQVTPHDKYYWGTVLIVE